MIKYEGIKAVHLELSTNCNASCPLCPRNAAGVPYNAGYPITELTLADIRQIFPREFVSQLNQILINGNLGDFMLARDGLEIVEYFRQTKPNLNILISTNGSARTTEFWTRLGSLKPTVNFCLDGLEDTHSLYRKDTNYNTIIKNAQAFILAGGIANWKMIKFDHNLGQVDKCRELANSLGFVKFDLVDHGRSNAAVYDKKGNYQYSIGSPDKVHTVENLIHFRSLNAQNKIHYKDEIKSSITCETKVNKMIYISANGDVAPCCYHGFYPHTYDSKLMLGNEEIKLLFEEGSNNAKDKPLRECLEWFNKVEESWNKLSFESGRLWRCNHHCGH